MTQRDSGSRFTPISPNPFIVGTPVREPAMFFGRESEFELVQRRFHAAAQGGLIVFCGERRSGKTSILFQILQGRLGPEFIPVLIDMQSMVIENEAEFLRRIVLEILQAVGTEPALALPDFAAGGSAPNRFCRFIEEFVRLHPAKKLILLFDEYELFENKIEAGVLTEDVLNILSNLMENQSVFLVFTGSQHIEQRRRVYWKILPKSIYRTISYLQPEDTRRLIEKPVEGRVRYADGTVGTICRLTAGQPFYTQAICQNLVDNLNEKETTIATPEILDEVVRGIVENPFPQMIFLWDGLEADEKLVLALAAEVLDREDRQATVDELMNHLRTAQYPLDLTPHRAASALEGLFKKELLTKTSRHPAAYAFRMDLWRLWIRRMHSVWQVMREVGIEVRRGRPASWQRRRALRWSAAAGALAIVAALAVVLVDRGRSPGVETRTAASIPEPFTLYALLAEPRTAVIYRDAMIVGSGEYRDSLAAGLDVRFRLVAEGYAETTFVVQATAGRKILDHVALRPLRGHLEVETDPPGASIQVDGIAVGQSPVTVRGLAVPVPHTIAARSPGHRDLVQSVSVRPDSTLRLQLRLVERRATLDLTTDPAGAEIFLDGRPHDRTPARGLPLSPGLHSIRLVHDGYRSRDTSITAGSEPLTLRIDLEELPPGILELQGDSPARMFVDGALVAENLPNSGRLRLRAGLHAVKVVLLSGDTLASAVEVRSGERIIYDYSSRSVTSRHALGGQTP